MRDGKRHSSITQMQEAHIEGYAIVSEDGMLADAARVMPESLKFEADQRFFEHGLDGVDVIVHGRHSQERQPRSHLRHRLVVTRRVSAVAAHPSNARALLWNPAGASFEQALSQLGTEGTKVGVIGGPDVFALFLDRYDVFYLTRAPNVRLPGGRPVFPEVPGRTPEEVLAHHGFDPDPPRMLDQVHGLTLVCWRRAAGRGKERHSFGLPLSRG
jgi:dihydrofolate reductase